MSALLSTTPGTRSQRFSLFRTVKYMQMFRYTLFANDSSSCRVRYLERQNPVLCALYCVRMGRDLRRPVVALTQHDSRNLVRESEPHALCTMRNLVVLFSRARGFSHGPRLGSLRSPACASPAGESKTLRECPGGPIQEPIT